MLERLHQLWYHDLQTRRLFQLLTILIGAVYGSLNSLFLGRSEKQVTIETVGVVCFLTIFLSLIYCLRRGLSTVPSSVRLGYVHLGELFRQNFRTFAFGLAAVVLVCASSLLGRLAPGSVQAAAYDMRFSRAISSLKQLDGHSADELRTVLQSAAANRITLSPKLLRTATKRVTEASQKDSDAWPATLALLNYRSNQSDMTSAYPVIRCLPNNESGTIKIVASNNSFTGCSQVLDRIAWKNSVFLDSTIIYRGGPVVIENVQFKHCRFVFDYTPESQELAKRLAVSDTVTITVPGG